MAKRMNVAISLVLCVCALPWIAFGAEPAPAAASNAVQTAQQLVAAMKKAAKATGNRMAGLSAVKPRTPYRGALAVDAATGDVLFQDNADVKAHPASCTKMMTLLLVLEDLRAGRYALSDKVAASAYAATFRGSSLGVKAGEALTVDDLLYALMVRSANDGAVMLAEHSSGRLGEASLPTPPGRARSPSGPNGGRLGEASLPESESKRLVRAFVDRMNRRALELGMKDTRFVSPNGMTPYLNQAYPGFDTSTAADLARLARHLVTIPEAFKYTSCAARTIALGDKDVSLAAHNYFLPGTRDPQNYATPVPGCDGLKTGFTDSAGASVVLTAQRGGRRVVVAVLGCAGRRARETAAARILRAALDAASAR